MTPKLGIIGLGTVGYATLLAFQHYGYEVAGYDLDISKVASAGAVARGFHVEKELHDWADILFVCVGTPLNRMGTDLDLTQLETALATIPRNKKLVIRSTIPIGTSRRLCDYNHDLVDGFQFWAHNPEFLEAKNAAEQATHPKIIVIGVDNKEFERELTDVYAPFHVPIYCMSPEESEALKLYVNSRLATNIALAQEWNQLAAKLNVNFVKIMKIAHSLYVDHPWYVGQISGACLPKDTYASLALFRSNGLWAPVLTEVKEHIRVKSLDGEKT